MSVVTGDRVKETSTTTGTGAFTLAGAIAGFRTFASLFGSGTTAGISYCIHLAGGTEWEVGKGSLDGTTMVLTRTTVEASSNSGAAVNFSAGTKNVFTTISATDAALIGTGGSGTVSYLGYDTVGGSTESGSGIQWMKKITTPSAGVILNIEAYGDVASQFIMSVNAGVQADSSGSPDHFLGGAGQYFNLATSVPRWLGIPVNVYAPSAGDYWICFKTEQSFAIRYDVGTDKNRNDSTTAGYLKDGSIAAITTTARKYSIRAAFLA